MSEPLGGAGSTRYLGLSVVLAGAMAVATVAATLLGVLAPYLRAEIDMTPADLGLLVAIYAIVSAAVSWPAGTMADAIGGRRTLILVFAGAATALVTLAWAASYLWLVLAMVIAGLANSAVNPATNQVIAESVPAGRRGLVAGVKMAGVQLGVFAAGALVPPAAEALGWRLPLGGAAAVVCGLGTVALLALVEDTRGVRTLGRAHFQWSPELMTLTLFSLLMSAGANATLTYLPLYVVEALGSTGRIGGWSVAMAGLVAIIGRLGWGRATERSRRPLRPLIVIGAVAIVSAAAVLFAPDATSPLFWLGVTAFGLSALSFVAATTVALILSADRDHIGGASGIMFVGFMIGFGGGPAAFGFLAQAFDNYTAGWVATATFFTLATAVALSGLRHAARSARGTTRWQ